MVAPRSSGQQTPAHQVHCHEKTGWEGKAIPYDAIDANGHSQRRKMHKTKKNVKIKGTFLEVSPHEPNESSQSKTNDSDDGAIVTNPPQEDPMPLGLPRRINHHRKVN